MEHSILAEENIHQLRSIPSGAAQFKVASIEEGKCSLASYGRRDFYKVTLILNGNGLLHYANRDIRIDRPALIFTNPMVPYAWDDVEDAPLVSNGYFCVFTDAFLQAGGRMESLQDSNLFKAGGDPVYLLNDEQVVYLTNIFSRMRAEVDGDYIYRYELMRSQVNLIIHEAVKMQPAVAYAVPQNAAARIARLFIKLLEKQFPIESPNEVLKLKKASEYADQLAVHVNHLNAAVQEVTGKSTTAHISESIISEAKSLLSHTSWTVSQIASSLGFEYASYFNSFFKKHTGVNPMALRKPL